MTNQIQWLNALSTRASLEAAVAEVVDGIKPLSNEPNLGIVFISSAYASEYSRLVPLLLEQLPLPVLIGCGGGGIIGTTAQNQVLEVESNPALSLSVASLPNVDITAFYLAPEELPDLDSSPEAWIELVGVSPQKSPQFLLLSDPFAAHVNDLLEGLDFAYPGSPKVGGLASASSMGVPSGLFYHSQQHPGQPLYREGTVGVALSGEIVLETIVAQGCRPIGKPFRVSQAERNVILELVSEESASTTAGITPLEALRHIIQNLSEKDRQLVQHSLFVGVVGDEFKLNLEQGDFLIRTLLGVDPKLGAIAIGDRVRPGQRIQFHLRDSSTSAEDLELLLKAYQKGEANRAKGALMFSCLGRGEALYGVPNFDSELLRRYLTDIPLGGFFGNGEIGPVGGRTFLHGYTSALAILRQPEADEHS